MDILRNIEVPTGNILIVQGEKGKLECLSIGDYGKEANIKASFLGLDRPIGSVEHQEMLPLEDKWVITISSQYGCNSGCIFCDVPKVGKGLNATYKDMLGQIETGLSLHPEVKNTNRLNIHYARMGEPTWNIDVLELSRELPKTIKERLKDSLIHPVVSTMMPKYNNNLEKFLVEWMDIKNNVYKGDAGLQISINSTSEKERHEMFKGSALSLKQISEIGTRLPFPRGRKITLNFAVADYEIDADKLKELFSPEKYIVKLTPMHKTNTAIENGIETGGDYTTIHPYLEYEEALKEVGFDVLVFIASEYEDMGRITCGNALLSGTMPECSHKELIIKDIDRV